MNDNFQLITSDGFDDRSRDRGWGSIPPAERHAWARALVDYYPWFPGATMMNFIAAPILAGGTNAPERWKRVARDLHAVGFSADDYYALCQELLIRQLQKRLTREEHSEFFEDWNDQQAMWMPVPIAAKWETWPMHIAAGRTPRRATDYVLSGGAPAPMGMIVRDTGEIEQQTGD